MKRFIKEDTAMGDVMIQDPQIAQQILNLQKQNNDDLKRIAQLQSQMAIRNQNINGLKNKAVQAQKATQTGSKKAEIEVSQENSQPSSNESLIMPSLANFLKEDTEEFVPEKTGEEQDGEEVFFVRIPPQEEYENEVIAKLFKVVDDGRWYVRDIMDEADFLDELVFNTNYDKLEIIEYLTSIFGEVEEIDREDYDEAFDDKEEMDDLFFGDEKSKPGKNKRVKLTK